MMSELPNIVFFGGDPLGVPALTALKQAGIAPKLIVCSPDRRAGRGQQLHSPPVKLWAETEGISCLQPSTYTDEAIKQSLTKTEWDLFVVVAYNHILPAWVLNIPRKGCLNVHPSLLPLLRGPSPIRSAILHDLKQAIGVSIILLDEKMDHGPILKQEAYVPNDWPTDGAALDTTLASIGGSLLATTIQEWLSDELTPEPQDHTLATYTKKFAKGENELDIEPHSLPNGDEAYLALCKIRAWSGIGDTFFVHNGQRVKVKTANVDADGTLRLETVIPAGKQPMSFDSYLQSLASKQ
jgi:methionyl-tRNA formyltransferase